MLRVVTIIFLMTSAFFSAGCSGGSAVSGGDNFPSELPDSPTAGFDTTGFFVGVRNSTEIRSHVRTAGSFGTSCQIDGEAASTDLVCYVDVPEGDLYFSGVDLVYNVPAGMCRYLARETYWYYNEELGQGPGSITMNYTINGDATAIVAATCSVDGGATGPCNGFAEVEFDINGTSIEPKCVYDRTDSKNKNCCLGDYTLTSVKTAIDSGGGPSTVTTTVSNLSWESGGQQVKSCIGGAGRVNWSSYTKGYGYPTGVIEFAENGISETYKLESPNQKLNNGSNYSIANFYSANPKHTHGSFATALTSDLPYFIEPITDRNGTGMVSGNDSYSFECLDEAFETKHRIRVYVRDWDTYADYLAYIASSGVTSVPDSSGLEGVGCTEGLFGPCNDNSDLDNFIEGIGGTYFTVTPSQRSLNFPFHDYD